ncbi:type VI secretion system tip protein TssI/VgrG [Martelella mangrovi]|uniref:Type VI secretion system secreted protein VgrG n=1 Tax=Martelella mangrovi TaxID=1397477 RepID=A0ABV2IGE9_9HYPH
MNAIIDMPVLYQDQDIAFTFEASALKDAKLLVHGFAAEEKLFDLTQVDIELVSDDPRIDLNALLDTPATLTIHHKYAGTRHLSGVIAGIDREDEGFRRTFYKITLLPMLSRLEHGSDCRIFQQKTVPDIIKQVLKECGVEDVQWHLAGEHLAREFCVQYRETHLAFIKRIAADEGIWFYFTHGENGQHTAHFIDMPQIVAQLPDMPELEYNANPGGAVKGVYCNRFSVREKLRSTSYTQRDYTFKRPGYSQEHRADRQEDNGSKRNYDLYSYPGRYKQDAAGKPSTQYRMEAVRVEATTANGQTNAIHLSPGFKTALTDHQNDDCNIEWHLLSVSHKGEQPQALKEEAGLGPTTYSNRFTAMPARLPYRPQEIVPPLIGDQTAVVTGPEGEEIYTDKAGRVILQFKWDRYGESDERSSCWVRVSDGYAGAMEGQVILPRVGDEVIVSFLEHEPDQPVVTGRVYNERNRLPYALPDNKTRSVLRSDTHKGKGYNELSFENESGQQNVFLHAQKDHTVRVLNNHATRVENNQVESVGSNRNTDIGANHHEKIGGSKTLAVGGGAGSALAGALAAILAAGGEDSKIGSSATGIEAIGEFAQALAAAAALSETAVLGGNAAFKGAGNHFTEAGGEQQATAARAGDILSSVMPLSGILSTLVEKFQSTTVGLASTEQIGAYKNTSVGHTHTINVGEELIIKVGKSRLIMDKEGNVTITGTTFNFTASGHVQINGKVVDLN